jgi:hypothetical protein
MCLSQCLPPEDWGDLVHVVSKRARVLSRRTSKPCGEPDLSEAEKFEKMGQSNEELKRPHTSLRPTSDSTPLLGEDRDRD